MRKVELTSDHQPEGFGKSQKETPVQMSYQPPRIHRSGIHLGATRKDPESERLARDNPEANPITIKPGCESHSSAVLLGSLPLLLSAQAPLSNDVFCFVGICVSSDNSFLNVRQELTLKPWKGSSWEDFRPFSLHLCDFSSKC